MAAAPPANGRIAYGADEGSDPEIYTVEPDGSNVLQLTTNGAWDTDPAVSPNGAKIAFSSDRDGNDDIWVMGSDGSGAMNVTGPAAGSDTQPDWSPNGTRIVFIRDEEMFVVASDGSSAPVKLKAGRSPAWSPNGKLIAFVRPPSTEGDIYVMSADGTGVTRLTTGLQADSPTWSPNGSKIAFEAIDPDTLDFRVYSMAANGTDLTRLTGDSSGQDFDPDYSPDGSKLVFTRVAVDADLMVADSNGGGPIAITSPGPYEFLPSWGTCSGASCPTPSPSASVSASPSPSASPSGSPTQKLPTRLSLTVVRTLTKLKGAGHLDPAHPGGSIAATLSKRNGSKWRELSSKMVVMKGDSYRVAFARPSGGARCRIVVRFAGDDDHLASSRSKRLHC
jgi:tricorn protease-like protein